MAVSQPAINLSANSHASAMTDYIEGGVKRAMALGNRGPIELDSAGRLDPSILDAYWRCGFYVFEGVIAEAELADLRADLERVLAGAPVEPGATLDAVGRPAIGQEFTGASFNLAKPLSDPVGGTSINQGRHPVKMAEPEPPKGAPKWTVQRLRGNLQIMDSCLCLYGHPGLLSVAAAVNGDDFVPFNEVTFVKEPGLGVSIAWHRDGTTHWNSPDWDQGAHGFNFMAQVYGSTPGNGVWVVPGTHKHADIDIRELVKDAGSERIDGAVPMICAPGDVVMSNRQVIHGSFANTSPDRRITLNMGFFPRRRILNVTTKKLDGADVTYDEEWVHTRSRMIAVAIDARQQRFPGETRYHYWPLADEEDDNRWNEETRQSIVKDYNMRDFHL